MSITLFKGQFDRGDKTPRFVRHALETVIKNLVSDKTKNQILLVATEVLVNICQHSLCTEIYVTLLKDKQDFTLHIKDNATQFNLLEMEEVALDDDSILLESSRGIGLIKSQSDHLSYVYNDAAKLNELTLYWGAQHRFKSRNVLILDDSDIQLEIYQEQLGSEVQVFATTNPVTADEIFATEAIDIIICDLYLPNMNGLEFFSYINKTYKKSVPFIMITSCENNNDGLYFATINSGVDEFLTKPTSGEVILSTIEKVFARRQIIDSNLRNIINSKISESLAPNVPSNFKYWDLALGFRNTGNGGGDFILHQSNVDSETLLLADVMGHDECSKFFSFAFAGYLRGLLFNPELCHNSNYLLEILSNTALTDKVFSQTMLTCCVVNLGLANKVSVSTAGHPPPLLITKDEIKPIATSGIMLGILEHAEYEQTNIVLQPEQRLLIYTDGLFDSVHKDSSRDELHKALYDSLMATMDKDIESALDNLLHIFDEINQGQPTDDVLIGLIEGKR